MDSRTGPVARDVSEGASSRSDDSPHVKEIRPRVKPPNPEVSSHSFKVQRFEARVSNPGAVTGLDLNKCPLELKTRECGPFFQIEMSEARCRH